MCSVDLTLISESFSELNLMFRLTTSGLEAEVPFMLHEIARLLATHLRFTIDPKLAFTEVGLLIKAVWVQRERYLILCMHFASGVYHLFVHVHTSRSKCSEQYRIRVNTHSLSMGRGT